MSAFERVVEDYLSKHAKNQRRYLRFYETQRTLAQAVEKAAMAELPNGERFCHQKDIPQAALERAKKKLLKLDFGHLHSFDELHALVKKTISPIPRIGALAVYDTAHRIGAYLKLHPQRIYLHAGTSKGAQALGLNHEAEQLPMSALPKEFGALSPEQAEDCLCFYQDQLRRP